MRVIAGTARSLILKAPLGDAIRPTIDRLKENVFNSIQHEVLNAHFLDLFSGTGAIGIEALSRGAKKAVFVEQAQIGQDCIIENLNHTKLIENSELFKYDCIRALQILEERRETFDLIYMDPPYNQGYEAKCIVLIDAIGLLKPGGLLICESDRNTDFSFVEQLDHLRLVKEKIYKTSKFTYLKCSS